MSAPAVYSTTGGKRSAEDRDRRSARLVAVHKVLDNVGVTMSASKVARLVQRFEREVEGRGWSLLDFVCNAVQLDAEQRRRLALDPETARVIAYADPTGETAVRNVLRGSR